MKVRLGNLLTSGEWATLGAGLLAAGSLYVLLVRPSLELCAGLDGASVAKADAQDELDRARADFDALERQIARARRQLVEVGGPPPDEDQKDLQIARLTALASRCGVTVDQYSPVDTVDNGDYLAFFVQFVGRGGFDSIRRYFARVESDIDFVDLTHFTISSAAGGSNRICSVAWSCRITGMRADIGGPPPLAQSVPGRHPPMEVVMHGR